MARIVAITLILAFTAFASGAPVFPEITAIDGIDFRSLFEKAPPSAPAVIATTVKQIEDPFRPMSARTIYRPFFNLDALAFRPGNNVAPLFSDEDDNDFNLLIVDGTGFEAGVDASLRVFLKPKTEDCSAIPAVMCSETAIPTAIPNAVARTALAGKIPIMNNCELQPHASYRNSNTRRAFYLPVARLAMFESQASQICVQLRQVNDNTKFRPINTQLSYMVMPPCWDNSTNLDFTTTFNTVWDTPQNNADFTIKPAPFPTLCDGDVSQSKLPIGGLVGDNEQLDYFHTNDNQKETPGLNTKVAADVRFRDHAAHARGGQLRFQERQARTKCCGFRAPTRDAQFPGKLLVRRFGMCINPKLESCCSGVEDSRPARANIYGTGKPYDKHREKCCFGGEGFDTTQLSGATREAALPPVTSFLDDFCPCLKNRTSDFCTKEQRCCTFEKYSEISSQLGNQRAGRCYNPLTEGCCDTGDVFNPGSHQCCVVSGVTSLDQRCGCSSDLECPGKNSTCCKAGAVRATQAVESCNAYSNFPSGSGFTNQKCQGHCIDNRFESCCNNELSPGMTTVTPVVCRSNIEKCCGNRCCNKFTESCNLVRDLRPVGWKGLNKGDTKHFNSNNAIEVCTSVEYLSPFRAAIVYVLPGLLFLTTFVALALALYFAKRQNAMNPLSGYEKFIVFLSFLVVVFAWPLIFSALWKYALVFALVGCFSICAALVGVRGVIIAALFVQVIALLYFFDFFAGSDLLTFGAFKEGNSIQGTRVGGTNGVFQALREQGWDAPMTNNNNICVSWFDFFTRDQSANVDVSNTESPRLANNAKKTFGYCERGWNTFLLFTSALEMIALIFLFFATLVAHAKNVLITKVIRQNPLHF